MGVWINEIEKRLMILLRIWNSPRSTERDLLYCAPALKRIPKIPSTKYTCAGQNFHIKNSCAERMCRLVVVLQTFLSFSPYKFRDWSKAKNRKWDGPTALDTLLMILQPSGWKMCLNFKAIIGVVRSSGECNLRSKKEESREIFDDLCLLNYFFSILSTWCALWCVGAALQKRVMT